MTKSNESNQPEDKHHSSGSALNCLVMRKNYASVVNDCINTAVGVCNMSDDDHVTEMATHIANQLMKHSIEEQQNIELIRQCEEMKEYMQSRAVDHRRPLSHWDNFIKLNPEYA